MIESIFQTFFFLATFDTILISVSIANYAISASYLGRETRLTRRRMEKRKQELDVRIKELQNKGLSIEELEEETTKAKDSMDTLKRRLFFLSWIGAVLVPSFLFVVSLVFSVLGMNSDILLTYLGITGQNTLVQDLLLYSALSLGVGFSILLVVIRIIDSAARKIPIPEFEVIFENKTKTIECKRNEKTKLLIFIRNKGEDKAEDLDIYVHFPPSFIVEAGPSYRVAKQSRITGIDFPDYTSAHIHRNSLHIETVLGNDIAITAPNETQTYEIPVYIHETKTGLTKDKLKIQVTD